MKIGIDAREIQDKMTGISRYLTGFLKHISSSPHEYFLYYSQVPQNKLNYPKAQVRILKGKQFVWDHILLPKALAKDHIDLFFSPYYKRPWSLKCKSIVTVHDINPLFIRSYSFFYKHYFKTILRRSLSCADYIMVVSRYVKDELIELFNADPEKIIVNYNALDKSFITANSDAFESRVLEKYKIKTDYILYVGNLMPHKNVSLLIKAYSGLPKGLKDKYKLVIAGGRNWTYQQQLELSRELGLENSIIFAGFIDDEALASIYRRASLFVFPSLREGFGFPPLESMGCGIPVVASRATSLPEIIGDAGILVNPSDVGGFTKAMEKVLNDESLQNELAERGLKRAKEFSTEKMAAVLFSVFEKLSYG
ncbi:MAG: glycosyltransferase family 4 protein [Omnitrophica bacterium]|nr:glycosyltransferase family 4 protein [Candidatus Omnitrophota bacterium]